MDPTPATLLWCLSAALFAFAFVAAWAERRRARRPNLDRPGYAPWHLLQILAFLLALIAAVVALRL